MEEFYKNTSVLITGATGFVGKSVVEKLLRAVPNVAKIHVLIRPKRGQDVHSRLQDLLQSPVFDRVKQENEGVLEKIHPIVGDISFPDLGISNEDRILLERNVSVVIHSAATIKFKEQLKIAVEVNVRGTQRVVELCKRMTNLKALVYVSTAYSNSDLKDVPVQEKVYSMSPDSMALLQKIDTMDVGYLEKNVESFLGNKPNTYTFTKAMAEYLLEKEVTKAGIPACIVRPSMITGAWEEPVPGWIEGFAGPVGTTLAGAIGLLKVAYGDSSITFDTIPIDLVVTTILTAAWATGTHRQPLTVYNCCSGTRNPITLGRYLELTQHYIQNCGPLYSAVWYPHMSMTPCKTWYETQIFLFHFIPACLMDLAAILRSRSRQVFAYFQRPAEGISRKPEKSWRVLALHRKIIAAARIVEYFAFNEWRFETNNITRLREALKELPGAEQKHWVIDVSQFSWEEYVPRLCHGIKTFLMKEAEATAPLAKRRHERLRLLKRTCDVIGSLSLLFLTGVFLRKLISIIISY